MKRSFHVVIDTSKIITLPKNWLPQLTGVIAGALGFLQAYMIHDWHTVVKDPITLCMFVLALNGFVSKQSNVTGGTVGQASTPEALHAANQAPSVVNPPVPEKKP